MMEDIHSDSDSPPPIIEPTADEIESKDKSFWDRYEVFNVHKLKVLSAESSDLRHVPARFFFATDTNITFVRRKHMNTLVFYDPMPDEFRVDPTRYFPHFKIEQYFETTRFIRSEPVSHVTSFLYANLYSMELFSFAKESKIKAYLPTLISRVAQEGHYGALRRYGEKLSLQPMSVYACDKYHRKGVIFRCCRKKTCCHMA